MFFENSKQCLGSMEGGAHFENSDNCRILKLLIPHGWLLLELEKDICVYMQETLKRVNAYTKL